MEINDLHTKQHRYRGVDHIPQDPGDLFREQIAYRTCQKTAGNGEKHRKQHRYVLKFRNVKNDFNISKGGNKKQQ